MNFRRPEEEMPGKLGFWTYLLLGFGGAAGLQCRDDKGEPTDFWAALKGPSSFAYNIYTAASRTFNKSQYELTSWTDGALAKTVGQLWSEETQYIIYNDESPLANSTYDFTFGHTKGLLAYDYEGTGFWLTHSVPKFPLGPTFIDAYDGITPNAYTYGQSLFCKTFSADQLNDLAGLLLNNRPNIQDSRLDSAAPANFSALAAGKYLEPTAYQSLVLDNMTIFAKSANFGADLYDDCISPALGTNLMVESWIRGDAIGPVCDNYKVVDVKYVQLGDTQFSEYDDHSKYAVGDGSLVCFSDINRMTTQYTRGGGALCLYDQALHDQMASMIAGTNSC